MVRAPQANVGIVSAGKAHLDFMEALQRLGLDRPTLEQLGVRIYKPGLTWPLERTRLEEFAQGLEEILVVEEKDPVIENQLEPFLQRAERRRIVGKSDAQGQPLLAAIGELRPSR